MLDEWREFYGLEERPSTASSDVRTNMIQGGGSARVLETFCRGRMRAPQTLFPSGLVSSSENLQWTFALEKGTATVIVVTPDSPIELPSVDDRLLHRLEMSFRESPVEDGQTHPAEALLRQEWVRNPFGLERFVDRLLRDGPEEPLASTLRCLGRLPRPANEQWLERTVTKALVHRSVVVRDAIVQAVEEWGGRRCLRVLEGHKEKKPWLRTYIVQVIEDLREQEGA